jgi:hypothetical protein
MPNDVRQLATRVALEFPARGDGAATHPGVCQRVERVEQQPIRVENHPRRTERGVAELIAVVEHNTTMRQARDDRLARAVD